MRDYYVVGDDVHDKPILYSGRWRSECLSYTAATLSERREFCHLTAAAIRSYLLYLTKDADVVRVKVKGYSKDGRCLTSTPPFFMEHQYGRSVTECPTCNHKEHRPRWRRLYVAIDAAVTRGREAFADGLAFDIGNAAARVAWRLGVSCIVCGDFCGIKLKQENRRWGDASILSRHSTSDNPLCQDCGDNERRDIRKWRREHGSDPSEEWLLLMAAERLRKGVGRAA